MEDLNKLCQVLQCNCAWNQMCTCECACMHANENVWGFLQDMVTHKHLHTLQTHGNEHRRKFQSCLLTFFHPWISYQYSCMQKHTWHTDELSTPVHCQMGTRDMIQLWWARSGSVTQFRPPYACARWLRTDGMPNDQGHGICSPFIHNHVFDFVFKTIMCNHITFRNYRAYDNLPFDYTIAHFNQSN